MSEVDVVLPVLAGGQADSWAALIEIAPVLGQSWLLVGGQMVFLHEVERGAQEVRPTDDVDVVVDLRADPTGLAHMHDALVLAGFSQDAPSPDGAAHRYRRAAAIFDVLAPDNLGDRARLALGAGRTIEAPGTTQAFRRSSVIRVEFAGESAMIRRPNLVGSLVGKAAAATRIVSQSSVSRSKHVRDFDSLSTLLGPGDRAEARLTANEKRMLGELCDLPEMSELGSAAVRGLLDA